MGASDGNLSPQSKPKFTFVLRVIDATVALSESKGFKLNPLSIKHGEKPTKLEVTLHISPEQNAMYMPLEGAALIPASTEKVPDSSGKVTWDESFNFTFVSKAKFEDTMVLIKVKTHHQVNELWSDDHAYDVEPIQCSTVTETPTIISRVISKKGTKIGDLNIEMHYLGGKPKKERKSSKSSPHGEEEKKHTRDKDGSGTPSNDSGSKERKISTNVGSSPRKSKGHQHEDGDKRDTKERDGAPSKKPTTLTSSHSNNMEEKKRDIKESAAVVLDEKL